MGKGKHCRFGNHYKRTKAATYLGYHCKGVPYQGSALQSIGSGTDQQIGRSWKDSASPFHEVWRCLRYDLRARPGGPGVDVTPSYADLHVYRYLLGGLLKVLSTLRAPSLYHEALLGDKFYVRDV